MPRPRLPRWPFCPGLLVAALLLAGCSGQAPAAAPPSGLDASANDAATDAAADTAIDAAQDGQPAPDAADQQAGATDAAAAAPQLPAIDREALLRLQAWAALPTEHTTAVWPGLKVLQVPTALVVFDDDGVARRAWLLHWPAPPPGAQALQDPSLPQPLWRYDAAAAEAFDDSTPLVQWPIGDTIALLLPVSAAWLQGPSQQLEPPQQPGSAQQAGRPRPPGPWAQLVGAAAMERLRQVEGQWPAAAPCGQPSYPRDQEAIALFFLECAVLREALDSAEPAQAAARLREWHAIRTRYTQASAALMARVHHYDAAFAPAWYAGRRLAVLAGARSQDQVNAEYRALLAQPLAASAKEFDALVSGIGWQGAAALEVARRLGWPAADVYPAGASVWSALPTWAGPSPPALVEQAKARHRWPAMIAKSAEIMAIDLGLAP